MKIINLINQIAEGTNEQKTQLEKLLMDEICNSIKDKDELRYRMYSLLYIYFLIRKG